MESIKLGHTGLDIPPLCLGCMTYGEPGRGKHAWTLDEENSRPLLRRALDMGLYFLDTANVYSDGSSEEIVGRAIGDFVSREEVVLATKVHGRMRPGANGAGLSRKAIFEQIDASLMRLDTDYVDLYQIHRFDPGTPVEETMEALHDVVKAGKARYIGASSMFAWQFAKMQHVAERHGWTRFVSMQNHLNLLYREEEREMLPLCRDMGVAVIPWSPMARGRLTRPWDEATERQRSDEFGATLYGHFDADHQVVDAVGKVAGRHGVPRAQIALAWVMQAPGVTAPIIGASKPGHLDDAVAALSITLSEDDLKALESPYVPHAVAGHG